MKLRPLHDRVIVKRLEEERQSAGGILIPDTAAEKRSMGEVVAVGPGKTDESGKLQPMGVKPGDKVLFGRLARDRSDGLAGCVAGPRDAVKYFLNPTLDNRQSPLTAPVDRLNTV